MQQALAILSSTSVHVLDTKFMFIDDGKEYDVDANVMKHVLSEGRLVHPITGDPVDDYESKLVPYFVCSDIFLRAKAAQVTD